MIRRQLPVYSPLPFGALKQGIRTLASGRDPRPELSDLLGSRYGGAVTLTDSGTQALQLALTWIRTERRLQRGVALPAFGCYDLVTAAAGARTPVFFYDLDPKTLTPDLASLEKALSAGAGGVVVAPLYGMPVPWRNVAERVEAHGAVLVEDSAQAFGLEPGPVSDLIVLSFGRGKGWTGGRGGALLLSDRAGFESTAPSPPEADDGGWGLAVAAAAQWALGRPELYGLPSMMPGLALGETVYHAPGPVRQIAPAAAAIALATLAESEEEVLHRRSVAEKILSDLERRGSPAVRPVEVAAGGGRPAYLRLPLRARWGIEGFPSPREAARVGILPSYPRPLPDLEAARPLARPGAPYPRGAVELVRTLITVPVHSRLSDTDLSTIGRLLEAYATGGTRPGKDFPDC